jgi:hypothetical protein
MTKNEFLSLGRENMAKIMNDHSFINDKMSKPSYSLDQVPGMENPSRKRKHLGTFQMLWYHWFPWERDCGIGCFNETINVNEEEKWNAGLQRREKC